MKSFIYRYILYLTVVPFISCNSDLRIEGTYDFADSNDPMKSIIISEADQTGFVSIYYVMESPYSSNAEQIIFAQDRSKPDRTSDGGLLLESEWGQLIFETSILRICYFVRDGNKFRKCIQHNRTIWRASASSPAKRYVPGRINWLGR